MKSAFRLVAATSLLGLALISCEQPTTPPSSGTSPAFDATAATLEFIPDRATFIARFRDLPVEDFEKGKVAANAVVACPGPLDSTSPTNSCFITGDIKPGVQFNEDNPVQPAAALALVGPGKFGATSKNIAADDLGHAFIITFTGGNVTATGMDLVAYFVADTCQIDVYGANGLLGSTTAPCTNAGAFWGVSASQPITQIRILASKSGQTEGVDNIAFGAGAAANQPPVASFTQSCSGVTCDFTSTSTDPDGTISVYSWTFGDGGTSSAQNPSHQYATGGTYTVTLQVTDNQGATNSTSQNITVNQPPVANAGGPYSGIEGSAVSLNGGASSDPDHDPLTYDWDFGDGTTPHGTGVTPSHTYADNHTGGYTVILTVTDPGGLSATASVTATINNVAPTVGAITAPADPVEVGTAVAATASFTDPGTLDTHTASIDWGDGNSSSAVVTEANGSGSASGSHAYAAAGTYTVTLTVTDKDGGVGHSVFESIHVFQRLPPVAQAGGPYSGDEGSMVQFDGSQSSDPAGAPLTSFQWNFGDGATGDGAKPSHRYADNGPYTVTLTVTAANGLTSTATTMAMISNLAPVVGLIIAPVDPAEVGTSVTATAGFTDFGILDTHTASIDWGDGMSSSATVTEANGSGSASGSHAYPAAGVYTLTLTVTDKDGGVGQSVFQFVVVFNPFGGFVTGGGWIISPPGAYPAGPTLSGKATFGFVSKYPKNANTPVGNTEFDFHIGGLHFRSTSYDWLVVSTSKVRFKGSGTINGAGAFAFQVSAVDGDLNGGDPDTFRMTIWDKSTGFVIYDNEMGTGNGAPAITPLGGGSIVIHP